jgi:hypothetical protein
MENTNTSAEVISQDLLKNIFEGFEPSGETTPPENEIKPINTPQEQIEALAAPQTKEVEQKVEAPVKITTDYSKRLKSAIQDGLIENFAITYNDQEAYLEDIDDLTEEGYNEIITGWKAEKDKNFKEKYISTDSFDEQTKKLIEIKQAGGSITELIRENISAIDKITQLKDNIGNTNVQANIVGSNLQQNGLSAKIIKAQIDELIENGELESEATKILEGHLAIHSGAIEQKRQDQLQRVEQEKEDIKNLRKTLSAKYKEMGIPEGIQKVLVDNATKLDADKISNTDKLYFEAVKDPESFAELNYFLNNREEFKKWATSKKTLESKLNTIKPLFSININNQKKPKVSASTLEDYADEIINNHK